MTILPLRAPGQPGPEGPRTKAIRTSSGELASHGTGDDLHIWHPAVVPFPVATLAGFDITADGKILVTIPLRP